MTMIVDYKPANEETRSIWRKERDCLRPDPAKVFNVVPVLPKHVWIYWHQAWSDDDRQVFWVDGLIEVMALGSVQESWFGAALAIPDTSNGPIWIAGGHSSNPKRVLQDGGFTHEVRIVHKDQGLPATGVGKIWHEGAVYEEDARGMEGPWF